jgi:rhomboid protease GluP
MTAAPARQSSPGPAGHPAQGGLRLWAPILALIGLCTVIEGALWAADLGLWGPVRLRQLAYEYGGFWPGLLAGWTPNYPAQPVAMFLTYAMLHGGPGHLVANMITLAVLGREVALRAGGGGFLLVYVASALGGAGGYGLLAETAQPMVGASGALFGLAGCLLAWAYADRPRGMAGLWRVLRVALLLVAVNLAMYWALEGQLAWQTHLGGFVTGWVAAAFFGRGHRRARGTPGGGAGS